MPTPYHPGSTPTVNLDDVQFIPLDMGHLAATLPEAMGDNPHLDREEYLRRLAALGAR